MVMGFLRWRMLQQPTVPSSQQSHQSGTNCRFQVTTGSQWNGRRCATGAFLELDLSYGKRWGSTVKCSPRGRKTEMSEIAIKTEIKFLLVYYVTHSSKFKDNFQIDSDTHSPAPHKPFNRNQKIIVKKMQWKGENLNWIFNSTVKLYKLSIKSKENVFSYRFIHSFRILIKIGPDNRILEICLTLPSKAVGAVFEKDTSSPFALHPAKWPS